MSTLMCGVETWTWNKADISILTAAEIQFVRSIEGETEGVK